MRISSLCSFSALLTSLLVVGGAHADDSDVRISSLGFTPGGVKSATVIGEYGDFEVRRLTDHAVVYEGKTTEDDVVLSSNEAERLYRLDFSDFDEEGEFYLNVDGVGRSIAFPVTATAYDQALLMAMVGFYGWRANTDVSLTHQGQSFAHLAGHMNDGFLDEVDASQAGVIRDGLKGWYDAGDYGKYTVNGSFAAGMMLTAWEHYSSVLEKVSLPIPETGGALPDYLQELKYQLDWILKMQIPDGANAGAAYHKLTPRRFSGFNLPANDDSDRFYCPHGSGATADFAAVTAQASRVFRDYDATYADTLLAAAEAAWVWLAANPDEVRPDLSSFSTGDYDSGDTDDRLWAAAELWETTGTDTYLRAVETAIAARSKPIEVTFDWANLSNLGVYTYLRSRRTGRDSGIVSSAEDSLATAAVYLTDKARLNQWGRAVPSYAWGSNGTVARVCMTLQLARELDVDVGTLDGAALTDACAKQVGYLYGRNQYNRSQVTGHGVDPPLAPHDRRSGSDGVSRPYPGLLVGGGTDYGNWADIEGSYETNEVAINWNAALVYAAASLASGDLAYDGSEDGTGPMVDGPPPPPPPPVTDMIDDLEDEDLDILKTNGRSGAWYTTWDDSLSEPTVTNVEGGAEGERSVEGAGDAYTDWGAGIGFTFVEDGGLQPYDASSYTGFSFWVKGGAGAEEKMRVMVRDPSSDPTGDECSSCWDHFMAQIEVTDEWERHYVRFADMRKQGFGDSAAAPRLTDLYGIEFQLPADAKFELRIDEVGFIDESTDDGTGEPGTDGGLGGTSGMGGANGMAGSDPGFDVGDKKGGCGCRAAGTGGETPAGLALGLLLGGLLLARRRRTPQS